MMITRQLATAVMLMVLFMVSGMSGLASAPGSAPGSNRVSRLDEPRDAGDAVAVAVNTSTSEKLVLRGAAAKDEVAVMSGGRLRLAGRLMPVADLSGPEDQFTCSIVSLDMVCPDVELRAQPQATDFFTQLTVLLGQWGMCSATAEGECCAGDLDGDGSVGPADLKLLVSGCS